MRRACPFLLLILCVLATGCNRDPRILREKCVTSGNKYFRNGRYKEASVLYRRALQLDPKYAEAHYRLGIADLALGQYSDAAQAFQRACDLDKNNEDAAVKLASIYLAAYTGNPQRNERLLPEARQVIARILKANPKSYDGLRLDADLATATKEPDRAIERLREANEVKPWQPDIIAALMQQLANNGKPKEAERLGEEFLSHRTDYGLVYDLLFLYYSQSSRFDRAEEVLKSKATNLPADGLSRFQLAVFYYSRGQRPEMTAMLDSLRSNRKAFPQADGLIGDFYVRLGELDLAIQSYREQVRLQPKDRTAYEKRMVQVLVTQGKADEALQILSKLHKDNPNDKEVAAVRALLLAQGNPKQLPAAIAELESLVAKEPGSPLLQYNLGRVYVAKGDRDSLDKARHYLETSASLNPDFLPARLSLAKVQLARGENRIAVDIADGILKTDPLNVQARLTKATGLANMGEYPKARDELAAVLRSGKEVNEARFLLARVDFVQKRYAESEAGFLALVRAGDPRGITGVAKCKEAQGQPGAALQLLRKEVAKLPGREDYRIAIVDLEYAAGRYQEALPWLEELARKRPDSLEVLIRLGDVQNRVGNRQASIETFRAAHRVNPADVRGAVGLAMMLEAEGRVEEAAAAYEDVLKVDPENSQALNNWAYIKANQGVDLDRALGYAQRALRASPHDPNISDTLGLIYIRKNLAGPAVEVLRDVVTRVPGNPSFHLHLGMALFDSGEKLQAKKELETALRHKPSAAEQAKIRELVARIG